MKKFFIAVIAVALVAACIFGVFTVKDKVLPENNFKINEKSSLNEVINLYSNSVKNSKDNKKFQLDVTTYIRLDEIRCTNLLLNGALTSIIGYQVGDEVETTQSFSFENGVDINDSSKTPFCVIQPANSYIESFSEASLTLKSISCKDTLTSVSFETERESASLNRVIEAINPIIKGQDNVNQSAVAALAPRNSEFIDIGNILSTVVDMLGINNMIANSNSNDNETSSDTSNKIVSIDGGDCYLGATEITADIDESEFLNSVTISVPVELDADFKFMSNTIDAVVCITVIQTYSFSYV